MFVGAFQNSLRVGHFNESLAQKSGSNMEEVMNRIDCYVNGEESNMEKRHQDAGERPLNRSDGNTPQKEKQRYPD